MYVVQKMRMPDVGRVLSLVVGMLVVEVLLLSSLTMMRGWKNCRNGTNERRMGDVPFTAEGTERLKRTYPTSGSTAREICLI